MLFMINKATAVTVYQYVIICGDNKHVTNKTWRDPFRHEDAWSLPLKREGALRVELKIHSGIK